MLSWVLALIHVPLMANRRLKSEMTTGETNARVYKGRVYAYLRAALYFGLSHRWSFVFAMVGLLGPSLGIWLYETRILPRYGLQSALYGV